VKYVTMQFMLRHSGMLQAVVAEKDALRIFDEWSSSQLKIRGVRVERGVEPTGNLWAVDVDSILSIYIQPITANQQGFTPYVSGRN